MTQTNNGGENTWSRSDFAGWAPRRPPTTASWSRNSRSPRDGRFIEEIGTYDPLADSEKLKVDLERAKYWIANGAQPTDTVRGLLKKAEA